MAVAGQRLCIWCGVPMIVFMLTGFLLAGFVPPPSPADSAAEVAQMYRENATGIRAGLVLAMFGSALLAPFAAAISTQLRRIEGRDSPLAFAQLALGAALPLIFIIPIVVLETAAFRPERPAQSVQDLNDLGWLLFIAVVSTVVLELLVIGVCILLDSRPAPIYPRWAGYYNLWAAVMLMPGGGTVFFTDGLLAWNGLLCWWIPLAVFGSWLAVMTVLTLRAIDVQAAGADATSSTDPGTEPGRLSPVVGTFG
ncbi:hypothetical protein [Sporichthya sp.]|uniref:hypothetical protein n=1 Tax=Sporichthya sp. TaxID=65475 RepID=UPI00181DD6D9|nr:hypothetical protein [Sporichthya sp.]MBA3743119.1 hypothetical protein [Sporichthya sp.]